MSFEEPDQEDADEAAVREALRRGEEIDRGEVRPVPVAEAMDRLRARLRR